MKQKTEMSRCNFYAMTCHLIVVLALVVALYCLFYHFQDFCPRTLFLRLHTDLLTVEFGVCEIGFGLAHFPVSQLVPVSLRLCGNVLCDLFGGPMFPTYRRSK